MRLTRSRQLALLEDFALALHDGLSPLQASMELAQHARQYGLVDELALSEGIVQALNQGHSFASVLPRWFDADLCMLVSVGEHSGVLEQLLQQHRQFELQRQQAQQLFWRPLIYPMIMVVIAALASLLIGRQVMPKLAAGLAPEHWPLVSELLLTTSAGPSLLVMLAAVLATLLISWGPAWLVDWRWAWCRWLAAQSPRSGDCHAGDRLARGHLVVVFTRLRHRGGARSLRPDRTHRARGRRYVPVRGQAHRRDAAGA